MKVVKLELRVAGCESRFASCELRVARCELRVAATILSPRALCELRNGWRMMKDSLVHMKESPVFNQTLVYGILLSPCHEPS